VARRRGLLPPEYFLQEAGTLMTGGPFRVSRNPIYLGMTLVLLAVVLFDGPAAALPVPLLFAFAIQKLYIEKGKHFWPGISAKRTRRTGRECVAGCNPSREV
jgi:hypothetical protein